jgi:hypothetical protein
VRRSKRRKYRGESLAVKSSIHDADALVVLAQREGLSQFRRSESWITSITWAKAAFEGCAEIVGA